MNYLNIFRAEARERLTIYREAADEKKAEKDILDWLAEKILESYRNCQKKNQTVSPRTNERR